MDGRPIASNTRKAKQENRPTSWQDPHHGIGGRDPSFLKNKASLKGAANSQKTHPHGPQAAHGQQLGGPKGAR